MPEQLTGLATASLRRAIHDLRGPLNTLSILAEVLRAKSADADACASMTRAVHGLGTMLDRLRGVAETMPTRLQTMDLGAQLAAACGRAQRPASVAIAAWDASIPTLRVTSCPSRLPPVLDSLLQGAVAALPDGGTIRFAATDDADHWLVAVQCDGTATSLPAANTAGKLDTNPADKLDWFRLTCQVEGLAGELRISDSTDPPQIAVRLPKA